MNSPYWGPPGNKRLYFAFTTHNKPTLRFNAIRRLNNVLTAFTADAGAAEAFWRNFDPRGGGPKREETIKVGHVNSNELRA